MIPERIAVHAELIIEDDAFLTDDESQLEVDAESVLDDLLEALKMYYRTEAVNIPRVKSLKLISYSAA